MVKTFPRWLTMQKGESLGDFILSSILRRDGSTIMGNNDIIERSNVRQLSLGRGVHILMSHNSPRHKLQF